MLGRNSEVPARRSRSPQQSSSLRRTAAVHRTWMIDPIVIPCSEGQHVGRRMDRADRHSSSLDRGPHRPIFVEFAGTLSLLRAPLSSIWLPDPDIVEKATTDPRFCVFAEDDDLASLRPAPIFAMMR